MGKSISDRMNGAPDAVWAKLKGKYKALSGPQFKPDVTPILNAYHGNFQKYVDLLSEKAKLKTMLDDYMAKSNEMSQKISKLLDDLDKVQSDDTKAMQDNGAKIKAFSGDPKADLDPPNQGLQSYLDAYTNVVTMRKAIWDQVVKIGEQKIAMNKKMRDDFKTKADLVTNGVKKLEEDAQKQESQAKAILTNYQKVAVQIDHEEWVSEIAAVAAEF
jgi:hypothetical protein